MQTIFENDTLHHIVISILDGTAGFTDINELLIVNNQNSKYNKIVIKPCTINITEQILEVLADTKIKPEFIDTELNEFICYTKTIVDEDSQAHEHSSSNQELLLNQSLSEMILIDSEILNSTGWKLIDFSDIL